MSDVGTHELLTEINQEIRINGAADAVFRGLIDQLTMMNTGPDSEPLQFVLEERPGGRWYRDLGNDSGHLWGHVQSIKPGELLEIFGPLFMSFAVANNVIFRMAEDSGVTKLTMRHQVLGVIPAEMSAGMADGWKGMLAGVKKLVEG